MKLLTVTVPCYNSAEYMERCIESLLIGGEDIEIIIVNDGSTDATKEVADRYVSQYPSIIRAIHKENGGHGSGVNVGLKEATGLFFKVVDSDDWVQEGAYLQILATLRKLAGGELLPDMVVSNFVYEKVGEKKNKVMHYRHALPVNEIFSWKQVKHFRKGQYILMHSVIFRTRLLWDCELQLPENTFYVDNLYVFQPLPYVKNMYYMDVNFYRYYIGREDQSVNETIMISRIDQQLKVNRMMVDYVVEHKARIKGNRKLKMYMENYLEIVTAVSSILLIRGGTPEHLEKKKQLWNDVKQKDKLLYARLRYGFLGNSTNLPGKGGRKISVEAYKICRRFFKFN
ncbi:MAG: glycosyltransferase family 2 protein [Lachnospiraceae bacterium]|nr:glycosyltransferase family 2 protein [Lachnospiraceae bacterium]